MSIIASAMGRHDLNITAIRQHRPDLIGEESANRQSQLEFQRETCHSSTQVSGYCPQRLALSAMANSTDSGTSKGISPW